MGGKERLQADDAFQFTERERLKRRVSDERLRALLGDERTLTHRVEVSANDFGEYLFLTVSLPEQACQPVGERGSVITFWGLGYHEFRDRWLHAEWFWYESFCTPEVLEQIMVTDSVKQLLENRRDYIGLYLCNQEQSERGQLFGMLADLTDDDAALAEIADSEIGWGDDFL